MEFSRPILAMSADSKYVYPWAVALTSIQRTTTRPIDLWFGLPTNWTKTLGRRNLEHILEFGRSLGFHVTPIEVPIDVTALPPTLHISTTAFVKPAIFDLCPTDRTLVWLDCDLVVRRPWEQILHLSAGHGVSAVREDNPEFESIWSRQESDWYANTGVMVVDGKLWQKAFAERWKPLLANYRDLGFTYLDQDVINACVRSEWNHLPMEYNFRPGMSEEWTEPTIVHFAGWWKPWLRVKRQRAFLNDVWMKAFDTFVKAEAFLNDHLSTGLNRREAAYWRKRRHQLRGALGWKAYLHYARGSLRPSG